MADGLRKPMYVVGVVWAGGSEIKFIPAELGKQREAIIVLHDSKQTLARHTNIFQ